MSSLTDAVVVQRETYRRLVLRKRLILAGLVALLSCSVLLDLALGPASYGFSEVLGALFSPDSASPQVRVVMWDIRLPVALMAVAVGAALSLAGAQMQTILNNPLASPFTLGISAAAGFGAALGLAFGVALFPLAAQFMVPLNAFIMAMLSALLIHFLSMRRGVTAETIVLLGIALVFTFNALLALVQFFATEQAVAAVVFWTMGSLTKATWPKLGVICLVILITLPIFAKRAWALTALRLGDDKAASFGINVRRLRFQTLIMVSLLASFPVAFVGTIGFIGLVGPHIARMLIGEDQRFFLPPRC
jgi:iron complex transport system permease protein